MMKMGIVHPFSPVLLGYAFGVLPFLNEAFILPPPQTSSQFQLISAARTARFSSPDDYTVFLKTTNAPNFDSVTSVSDIDTFNLPPNLQFILNSFEQLKSGSDIRGTYLHHANSGGTIANIALLTKRFRKQTGGAALTPFAAHCFGVAFGRRMIQEYQRQGLIEKDISICIGRDPRPHGERLADAFARGAESVDSVNVIYTGLASTPAMNEFCRSGKCDASIMITASHLPEDKNGMKFFVKDGGLTKKDIDELITLAQLEAHHWYDLGILPPSSGISGVLCSKLVDFMPEYKEILKKAILREVGTTSQSPLSGLNIVVNPGKGSGSFFHEILQDLGANIQNSINLVPDGTFPPTSGVPNPEKKAFVEETIRACEACNADIGVMFDTDADRAGFVVPREISKEGIRFGYEPLNKNRLIALLSVVFSSSSPTCTIVTDSTTSEGLSKFIEKKMGLKHYRFLRGYANVIGKAKELTNGGMENAEMAIEISGHCAMKENGYADDGTYTAVKVIGLLARTVSTGKGSLLDLISDLEEMPYEQEYRIKIKDGTRETTTAVFGKIIESLKEKCKNEKSWNLDTRNLEGLRFRLASGGFFMIRQSVHDPVMSVQVESISKEEAWEVALRPFKEILSKYDSLLDTGSF